MNHLRKLAEAFIISMLVSATPATVFADASLFYSYWSAGDGENVSGIGLEFSHPIVSSPLEADLRLGFYPDVIENRHAGQGDATPIEVGLTYNFNARKTFNPYLTGGVGYHFLEGSGGTELDNELGLYAGGGIECGDPNGLGLMVEVLYRWIDDTQSSHRSWNQEFDLSGVVANIGGIYRW